MIAYLDTHVVLHLAEASKNRLSKAAKRLIETAELLISPMVLIEAEYMFEIGRTELPSRDLQLKLERELDAQVCTLPFPTIARIAVDEKWTRDPFDRMLVAQAKANGLAFLISADATIAKHYQRTVW